MGIQYYDMRKIEYEKRNFATLAKNKMKETIRKVQRIL